MWIELPNIWIAVINIIGIPACHLGISWWSTRLPASMFSSNEPKPTGKNLRLYEKIFGIRHWKHRLLDAAPWFDGFSKGQLESTDENYLKTFIQETKRGEFSHWIQLVVIACFVVWTPWPYALIILAYSVISNFPCILNLRYTRHRMRLFIHKTRLRKNVR